MFRLPDATTERLNGTMYVMDEVFWVHAKQGDHEQDVIFRPKAGCSATMDEAREVAKQFWDDADLVSLVRCTIDDNYAYSLVGFPGMKVN